MIDRALPPTRRGEVNTFEELLEAFAMCYLASYGAAATTSRTWQSYQRAWGFDNLKFHNRGGDGTPAFSMAIFDRASPAQIVIGIEGMSSFSQVAGLNRDFACVRPDVNRPGRCHAIYVQYANAIRGAILGDVDFQNAINHRSYIVTFAGFSLGAAIAEIIAEQFQRDNPAVGVKVKKFASPRVGNNLWNEERSVQIHRENYYIHGDPMFMFPRLFTTRTLSFTNHGMPLTWLSPDPDVVMQTFGHNDNLPYPDYTETMVAALLLRVRSAPTAGNPWWNHLMTTYRLHFALCAMRAGRNLPFYRIAALEHPDENNWQDLFLTGTMGTSFTPAVLSPPPGDLVVPPALYETQVAPLEILVAPGGGQGGGDWGQGDPENGVGGGDWGYAPRENAPRGRSRR